jgi:hypothetical protein
LTRSRALAAALAALFSLAARAYLPPVGAILRRVAQHRNDVAALAYEARGMVTFPGDAARRVAALSGLSPQGQELSVPALLLVKSPGRCRLELSPERVPPRERPAATQRGDTFSGRRGLDGVAEARALVAAVCTLLTRSGSLVESERHLARALASRGVSLSEVSFGLLDGRAAWVIGGRPQDTRPQAWIDKQSFQPVRFVAPGPGGPSDVRFLGFGSSTGGNGFPRTVEVWRGEDLALRFTAEKVKPGARIPDSAF